MNPRNADRDQAIASGRNKYQGKPCKHGHTGVRYIGGACVECAMQARAFARMRAVIAEAALIGGKPE